MCIPYIEKLMKPVVAFLRGGRNQIDYLPGQHIDPLQLLGHLSQSDEIHEGLVLGLIINEKKSQLVSSQNITFLGLTVSATTLQVTLHKEKILRIQQEATQLYICQGRGVCSKAGSVYGHDKEQQNRQFAWLHYFTCTCKL